MENHRSIIVYRSRQEENMDWFFNEMLFPWFYNNWWIPVLLIAAIIFWVKLAEKRRW